MRDDHLQSKPDVEFKRLCGVKGPTFEVLRQALQTAEAAKTQPGRPGALRLEAPVLMTRRYWRQYRTLWHLGTAVGVSEGPASRRVRGVEDVLVKAGRFALPKRRPRLAAPAGQQQGVALAAPASAIERPKKNRAASTAASASATP